MSDATVLVFLARSVTREDVAGKRVVELGARHSLVRPLLGSWGPALYVGADLRPGPDVDLVAPVERLLERLPAGQFDLVISTEMLEHVQDWRGAVAVIKGLCRPGGRILLTTRSPGFLYHGSPSDHWRYEPEDLRAIFSDCTVTTCEPDPSGEGVFMFATVPTSGWVPGVPDRALYSVVLHRRVLHLPEGAGFRLRTAWVAAVDWVRWAVRRNLGPFRLRLHGGH